MPLQILSSIRTRGRSVRRRVRPWQFKEAYVAAALAQRDRATYVEIGVRNGESFRPAPASVKIGIDPDRRPALQRLLPGERFFEMTSDEFFASAATEVLAPRSVDVALVDGLHEFRQIARDYLNLEPCMKPDGWIFVDDFNPPSRERAADTGGGGKWNGDGWKLAVFLKRARPELRFWTIDADEGVGAITGFTDGFAASGDGLIEECKALDYECLARDRAEILNLVGPREFRRTHLASR